MPPHVSVLQQQGHVLKKAQDDLTAAKAVLEEIEEYVNRNIEELDTKIMHDYNKGWRHALGGVNDILNKYKTK